MKRFVKLFLAAAVVAGSGVIPAQANHTDECETDPILVVSADPLYPTDGSDYYSCTHPADSGTHCWIWAESDAAGQSFCAETE